ncbi:MAG: glycosyltransferase [Planctomycetota bacterium]|nr:glycosyltransferase [Planctomycetota bacterium]
MKLALVAHAVALDTQDRIAHAVAEEALALLASGHDVHVLAAHVASDIAARVPTTALARTDLRPEHWHKTLSPEVSERWREHLARERPDVVHVHHWLGLSRDLVLTSARERVPAVVTLHDAWISCPIRTRTLAGGAPCDATVGALPCAPCASRRDPAAWVPLEQSFLTVGERQRDLARELELARVRLVARRELALSLPRWLGAALECELLEAPTVEALVERLARAVALGAPEVEPATWFAARLQRETLRAWDERCRASTAG